MKHHCSLLNFPFEAYGSAVNDCIENEFGEFWVDNGEYSTQVNFCPACGVKAPKQFSIEDNHATNT